MAVGVGRSSTALAGAVAMTLLLAMAASAQETTFVGLQVSPARVEQDLVGRAFKTTIVVANNEPTARAVTLSMTGLGHDLDGNPLFLEPFAAAGSVRISRAKVVLAPGARTSVVVEGTIPFGERSLYAALVAEPEMAVAPSTPGSVVVRRRVASLFFLRGPKPWREQVRVVDVGLERGRPRGGSVTVYAAVENVGNVHVKPTGTVEIVHDGAVLDRVRLGAATVLPGLARRLVGSWTPPDGITGSIELRAAIHNPEASGTGTVQLSGGLGGDTGSNGISEASPEGGGGARSWMWIAIALLVLVVALALVWSVRARRARGT